MSRARHDKVKCRAYGVIVSKEMNKRFGTLLKTHERNIEGTVMVSLPRWLRLLPVQGFLYGLKSHGQGAKGVMICYLLLENDKSLGGPA